MKHKSRFLSYLKSLKFKVLLLAVLCSTIPSMLLVVGFLHFFWDRSIDNYASEMSVEASWLSEIIVSSGYISGEQDRGVTDQIETIANSYDGRILVINDSFVVVEDTYDVDEGKTIVWGNVIHAYKGETTSYFDRQRDDLIVACPIISTSETTSETHGVILITRSMSSVKNVWDYTHMVSVIIFLTSFIIIVFVVLLYSRRLSKPFVKITNQMNDIQNGLDNTKLSADDYTEVAELSEQFNSFMAKMQLIDQSRQEFVSNVSHELKTPLTSMKVLADSLNSMEGAPVEMYQEFMEDIGNEIDRETQIINDLLTLVKMDKSQAKLNISPTNMNDMIEIILKRLRPIAETQGVELVMESFRPVVAEIDEVKLSLAITNLIENGIKYNNPNGYVHVSLNADHQYCYIRVEDNGMGMPEDALEHIFERFYRVDKSHSREIGGTGLGLAITHDSILMHKGEIKVTSTLEKGTTFNVRFPLNYIE